MSNSKHTEQTGVRLTKKQRKLVEDAAEKERRSLSDFIRLTLTDKAEDVLGKDPQRAAAA